MKTLRLWLCRCLFVSVFLCAASFALPLRADVAPDEDDEKDRCSLGVASAAGGIQFAWLIGAVALARGRGRRLPR